MTLPFQDKSETGRLATWVLHVNAGKITSYAGGYDYYMEKSDAVEDMRAALTAA
jgi:ATP-binding cassette subfamily F protein 3